MSHILKVVVSSTNPIKLRATEEGLLAIKNYADVGLAVESVKVDSGVSDQPRTSRETLLGALNRARNAQLAQPSGDLWVGLEGGVEDDEFGDMWSVVWAVILNKDGFVGRAQPGKYKLPTEIARLIRDEGMELGTADDIVFKRHNSKQADGSVGILTHGAVDRTGYYKLAITLAAIPLINEDLFEPETIDGLIKRIDRG